MYVTSAVFSIAPMLYSGQNTCAMTASAAITQSNLRVLAERVFVTEERLVEGKAGLGDGKELAHLRLDVLRQRLAAVPRCGAGDGIISSSIRHTQRNAVVIDVGVRVELASDQTHQVR